MANANSTARTDIKCPLDAFDALNRAANMTDFLQDVLTLSNDGKLPENLNTTGLYYVFQDIQDRIKDASIVLQSAIQAKHEA